MHRTQWLCEQVVWVASLGSWWLDKKEGSYLPTQSIESGIVHQVVEIQNHHRFCPQLLPNICHTNTPDQCSSHRPLPLGVEGKCHLECIQTWQVFSQWYHSVVPSLEALYIWGWSGQAWKSNFFHGWERKEKDDCHRGKGHRERKEAKENCCIRWPWFQELKNRVTFQPCATWGNQFFGL